MDIELYVYIFVHRMCFYCRTRPSCKTVITEVVSVYKDVLINNK